MTTKRERRDASIRAAITRLGGAECVAAFLRAAATPDGRPLAIRLAIERLDEGRNVDDVLIDGDEGSYILSVKRLGPRRFNVEFGCCPGPMVGDGGEWVVEFDREGRVVRCEAETEWIS